MILKMFYILAITSFFGTQNAKIYVKNYYENGKIKSEGWSKSDQKTDYWFYYYDNGNKSEEGHYRDNKKTAWWIFYDSNKKITRKSKFDNDKMDGLTIIYLNGKIIRAEKFIKGEKVKQWDSLSEFKKDNSISYMY